jgi:hypothetical protein
MIITFRTVDSDRLVQTVIKHHLLLGAMPDHEVGLQNLARKADSQCRLCLV